MTKVTRIEKPIRHKIYGFHDMKNYLSVSGTIIIIFVDEGTVVAENEA